MGRGERRPEPGGRRKALNPQALLSCLRAHGVEFVVIGGFSVAAHGVVRATKDVDIVPEPSGANRTRLVAALRELRAAVDLGDMSADELATQPDEEGLAAGGNWVLQTTHGRLDVMQDVPGVRSWQRLRAGAVERGGILYAGYDDLISMKSAAGRSEDLMDIAKLRAARGEPAPALQDGRRHPSRQPDKLGAERCGRPSNDQRTL